MFFSVHPIRRHMMLLCAIADDNLDHLVLDGICQVTTFPFVMIDYLVGRHK